MSTALTPEDIAAAIREGDLTRLLLMAGGLAPAPPARELVEPVADLPRARPGAWPTGTQSPGPIAPAPRGAWAEALRQYQSGADTDERCECAGCLPGGKQ